MPKFEIINNITEVYYDHEWIEPANFKSKERVVDERGQPVEANYAGRCYKLVAKRELKFSKWERLLRVLEGIWMIVRSFGRECSSKNVKNLFTKDHESRRFGVEIKPFSKLVVEIPVNLSSQKEIIADATASDFTLSFPKEIILEVLSYLDDAELAKFQQVNKKCKALASEESLWNALTPRIAFGKKQWATYFGDIGKAAPLPKGIHKILKSPCPFWPGKKVEETHMLVLIPETVNGEPLNLKTWGELVKAPKEGHATQYRFIWDTIINEHGNQATTKSHWMLMTNYVIEGSSNKNYTDQQILIAEFAKKTEINYEVPNVLDATIGIFMHYIRFGERLFNADNDLWVYTRCQEKAKDRQIVVGGFSPAGLAVCYFIDRHNVGVAALRKFF